MGGPVPCRLLLLCSAASHSSDCDSAGQVFLQAGLPPNGANPCFVCLRLMALTTIQYKPTQDFEPLCSRVAIEVGICPAWTQQQTCDMGKPAVKQARQAYSERHSTAATTVLAPNGTNPCMHAIFEDCRSLYLALFPRVSLEVGCICPVWSPICSVTLSGLDGMHDIAKIIADCTDLHTFVLHCGRDLEQHTNKLKGQSPRSTVHVQDCKPLFGEYNQSRSRASLLKGCYISNLHLLAFAQHGRNEKSHFGNGTHHCLHK